MEFNYLVYEQGDILAGFMSFLSAVGFIENYRLVNIFSMYLVDGHTGEIINTFRNGEWEGGVK